MLKEAWATGVNAEGVSQPGGLIPWKNIESIRFNGDRARIYTRDGSMKKVELNPASVDRCSELNDIIIKPNRQVIMTRLPNPQNVRVCFVKKTAHRTPRLLTFIGSMLASISAFLLGYLLQDLVVLMAIFVLAGLFFTRHAILDFRSLWFIYHSGLCFNPGDSLCIHLDATGLNYAVNGESTRFGWSDIEAYTMIYDFKTSYDNGYTLLNIKGNSKLTIPLRSPKLERAIADATGFTLRSGNGFAGYYGI